MRDKKSLYLNACSQPFQSDRWDKTSTRLRTTSNGTSLPSSNDWLRCKEDRFRVSGLEPWDKLLLLLFMMAWLRPRFSSGFFIDEGASSTCCFFLEESSISKSSSLSTKNELLLLFTFFGFWASDILAATEVWFGNQHHLLLIAKWYDLVRTRLFPIQDSFLK